MPLSCEEALQVAATAHEQARKIGIRVTVAVVDEGGLLQALARMDGAPPLSAQIAEAKAVGAALWHRDGASLAQVHQERPGFFNAVAQLVRVPVIPGLGSTLIRRDGRVLGAVGVSGGKPEQDLDCAETGLRILGK
jgi:glc operon protein GlcG